MLVARRRELAETGRLLDRAARGTGGLLVFTGHSGSGKTALAEAAADEARGRGFEVLWASPPGAQSGRLAQPGRMAWAQLLRDTGAPAGLTAALLGEDAGPLDLDEAARHLVSGSPRLIVVDDVDRGGPDAVEMLSVVAARSAAARVAVIATARQPLGLRPELRLNGLSEADLAAAVGGLASEVVHALWLASAGLPGIARRLAGDLTGLGDDDDPVVHLALTATSAAPFLDVDARLVRLLEAAASRARDDAARSRVLARLAYELLGDASAAARRRALCDEALGLARRAGDPGSLAEVLDARLHALWDPDGARDRLEAGSEIVVLARAAGDGKRERDGLFWQFVALMELGRVPEAESALAAFAREVTAAGEPDAAVMVTARHAMLAILHGRFDQASRLTEQVRDSAKEAGMADAEAISQTLALSIALDVSTPGATWDRSVDVLLATARERPGHLFEATAARVLAFLGRDDEAAAELDRALPHALASSGPRWLSAITDLAIVAAATGDSAAAARIYDVLAPYRGRLVMWGGASTTSGSVAHQLGLLAACMGRADEAVKDFEEAIELEERIGALPFLARSLAGLADALAAMGDSARASACRDRSREIAQRLGMSVLLTRLGPTGSEWTLTRDGDDWVLTAGDEQARLRDGRGLHYLRALVAAPGQEIRALDLAAGGAGLVSSAPGPVIDTAARDAYQRRLTVVTEAIEAADRAGDEQAAQRAEDERQVLLGELRAATGLGGRDRQTGSEAERARVNVTRTLRLAIDKIAVTAPRAAAHLAASVRTGGACRYDPAPGGPDHWRV